MMLVSKLINFARRVRHLPLCERAEFLWDALRPFYRLALNVCAGGRGIMIRIGPDELRLHPKFATIDWESAEAGMYSRFVNEIQPGDVIYDVGAHVGTYTIVGLRHSGPGGRCVSYEPENQTRQFLERHLSWNGCVAQTTVRDCCLGAQERMADFYFRSGECEGQSGLYPVTGFQKRTVRVSTLDVEVERLKLVPSVIKVDVEGAEWEVLLGARKTIARYKPKLFISLHLAVLDRLGISVKSIIETLKTNKYGCELTDSRHESHLIAIAQPVS